MNKEEAIKVLNARPYTGEVREALETLIPELRESKDERIRKEMLDYLKRKSQNTLIPFSLTDAQQWIAWLEKQKDASKAIEAVNRIDKYIDEHLANAHDMKDSNPDKKYYRGWDDALGKMAGILQDVYSGEKQKEPQHAIHVTKSFGDPDGPQFELVDLQKEQKPKLYWHKIKAYEKLPCRAYIYKFAYEQENNFYGKATINGCLIPNEPVTIGCDTWYLPVEDIKNLPKEDELDITGLTKTVEQKSVKGDNETETQKAFREGKSAGRKEVFDHPEEYGLQKPAEWNANDKAFIKDCANILVANDYAASAERLLSMFPIKPVEWSDTNELVFKDICKHLKEEGYNGWIVLLNALRNGEFQPKQEWGEEDELTIADLINYFEGDSLGCSAEEMVQRIKSLRPQPKQEWSEEDEKILERFLGWLQGTMGEKTYSSWLKSLPERFNLQTKQEWSEKYIADIFEKVGLAKIAREQGNDELTNALQDAMLELSKMRNTEWSEEDEATRIEVIKLLSNPSLYEVCEHLREESVDWLKTLHTKVNVNSEKVSANSEKVNVNWSEEDKKMIDTIVSVLGQYIDYKAVSGTGSGYATPRYSKEIDWLKSLPYRFSLSSWGEEIQTAFFGKVNKEAWRPSEEQMKALLNAEGYLRASLRHDSAKTIAELYEQLKKLM